MPRVSFLTAIGRCAISWNDAGLNSFDLPDAARTAEVEPSPPPELVDVIDRAKRHLAGELQDFADLRFDFSTTPPFNLSVLRATLEVKPGHSCTYGEIARMIGHPTHASRAVGRALGNNRWPLLIPCHRIVSASGKMTGFSGPGGITTKLRLLEIEKAQLFAE